MLGVGELTVATCIAQVDDDGAGLALGLSAHLLCQLALQQSGDLCTGVGQEGQGEHQQTRAEVELAAAHTLNGTCDHLLQHLLLGAQLAVAVNLDLHMAVGGSSHILGKLFHGDKAGVAFGLCMTHGHGKAAQRGKLVITAGCGAGCRCCGGGGRGRTTAGCHCTCCGHCAGYLQKVATRDLFHTIVLQLVSGRRETASCLSLCRSTCIQHLLRAAVVTKNTYFHKSNIH